MWSCWADSEELGDDDDCQSMTLNDEIVGFEGACKYELFGKEMKESDVPDCFDVDQCLAECHPLLVVGLVPEPPTHLILLFHRCDYI